MRTLLKLKIAVKKVTKEIDGCRKSGSDDVKNVKDKDIEPQCCAAWKKVDCWKNGAEKKCNKHDLKLLKVIYCRKYC
jgi:hypothetical protein